MSTPTKTRSLKWLLNTEMLAGAVLGWVIITSVFELRDTAHHHGPGTVWRGHLEWQETVSESQYKRERYALNGMMLSIGLVVWCIVAHAVRDKTRAARS